MAKIWYKDKVMKVAYDTQGTQTGLTDLLATVYNPANTEITGSPFTMTEIGTTGVYNASFTPDTVWEYTVLVSSALSSPAISNKAGTLQVLEDIMGATYNAATDSLEAIRDLGDTMDGKLDTINTNVNDIETLANTIDGKADTIVTTTGDTNTKVGAIPGATGSVI